MRILLGLALATLVTPIAHAAPPGPRIPLTNPTLRRDLPKIALPEIEPAPQDQIVLERCNDGVQSDLWLYPIDNGPVQQLTNTPDSESCPAWSPDKRTIAFVRRGVIWTIRRDGKLEKQVTLPGAGRGDECPRWHPNGKTLIFASERSGNYDIWTVPATGGQPTNLTNSPANENSPSYSPDGSRIAFATDARGFWDIHTMNADGTGSTRVRQSPFMDTDPIWGAGDTIAFYGVALHSDRNTRNLYLIRADGTALMKVADGHGTVDLSQDGRRLVRTRFHNNGTEIYFSDVAGNGGRFIGREEGARRLMHPSL